MRNTWKILFIVLLCIILILAIVAGIAWTNFHNGSGVRTFGPFTKFSTAQNCYFIDADTKQIIGHGEFRAHMLAFGDRTSGTVNIDQYPLTIDDMANVGLERINSSLLCISGSDIKFFAEYNHKEWLRYYEVWICDPDIRSQPKATVAFIHEPDDLIIAICAETEEEVWEKYEIYKECHQKGTKN